MGGTFGDCNLMTSQEFDNFCINGMFFLARGSPGHTLHHFYRSDLIQDDSVSNKCSPPLLLSKHIVSAHCSDDEDFELHYVPGDIARRRRPRAE